MKTAFGHNRAVSHRHHDMASLDPVILFFALGLLAGLARSDLRLPAAIYDFLTVVLLLAIGLKGGVELARQPAAALLLPSLAVIAMGLVLPLLAYAWLRLGLARVDAAAIAGHYGSVSVGTFAVAVAFVQAQGLAFEGYLALFVVLLEVPAIVVGIVLARGLAAGTRWGELAGEVLLGKSIVLLLGGLAIGWIAGEDGLAPMSGLFVDLFKGFLALFLLEMGLITAARAGDLRRSGLFLMAFAVLFPLGSAVVGATLGWLLGLSVGGTMLLATLAASASYIAAPAAFRLAVPQANPALSLAASLGITFPFNVLVGLPLYLGLARWLHA